MTSPNTWYPLAASLFLSIVPTVAEVVKSLSDCDQFLLEGTQPQVPGILEGGRILNQNRYKPICQTFDNERRFVTLYDTENRIPVFSAYKYRGGVGKRPANDWKIEPQLEDEDDKNMKLGDKNKTYNHQAGNMDYRRNRVFDRGHIFPSSHAFNGSDKMATFTLTNVVPQAARFNQGSWNRMETCVKCVMDKYCNGNNGVIEGFVVTGAQPSSNNILRNRINIPSMLWSAFCCYSANMKMWLASAHWADNVPPENKYLQTKTLEELHKELRGDDAEFKVFPGTQCPLHTTVTEFYPKIQNCNCPPSISPTSGPQTSTSAPSTSTSAPLSSTSASHTSTAASHTSTSGFLNSTSASHTSTSAPSTSTSASHTSTSDFLNSTSASHTSTSAPSTSTSASHTSTSAPSTSTSASLNSTSASHTSTSTSHTSTSASLTSTSAPSTSTSASHTSVSASLTSKSASLTSKSAPHTSTSGPHTSTSTSLNSTSASHTSTSAPCTLTTSTSAPLTSTSASHTSASAPHTLTSGPS